jgi:hypothetical protein
MTQDNCAGWENGLWRVAADSYGSRLRAFLLKRLDRQDVSKREAVAHGFGVAVA